MGRSWGDCRTCNTADGGVKKQPHYRLGSSASWFFDGRVFRWQRGPSPRGGAIHVPLSSSSAVVGSSAVIVPTMPEALRDAANYTGVARWVCDNVVLTDRGGFSTFITTPYWILTGRKVGLFGLWTAGIAREDI